MKCNIECKVFYPLNLFASMNTKVIIITGASSGIGKTTLEYLRAKGHTVYGTSRRGTPIADVSTDEFPLFQLDITNEQSVQQFIKGVVDREQRIDVLVNNAGFAVCGSLKDTSVEQLHAQFETNLYGVHRMVQAVLPSMLAVHSGTIITLGSFGGRLAVPYQSLYSASKAAVSMYSDALRMELWKDGIKISLIEPGDTSTEFHAGRVYVDAYSDDAAAVEAVEIMHKSEQKGANPLKVTKVVEKIIKAKRPKPRYLVGTDAKLFGFLLRIVSEKFKERLIMMTYNVPRK